jgi:hypothetical protein
MRYLKVSNTGKGRFLQSSEGVKLFEKKEEAVPSPTSAVQRRTIIDPVYPVAPVDVPRDIAVGHKRPSWAQ